MDSTNMIEVYGRVALNDIFAVTGDIRYVKDAVKVGDSSKGWIFGVRLAADLLASLKTCPSTPTGSSGSGTIHSF